MHQAAEPLSRLLTTGPIRRRPKKKYRYSASTPSSPKNKRRELWICKDMTNLSTKKVSGFLQSTLLQNRRVIKYDRRPISGHEVIQELAKDSYCRQSSYTVRLHASTFNYDRNGFWIRASPIDGAVQNIRSFPRFLEYAYYITRIIQPWRDTQVRDVCTIQCDANIIGHICPMMFTRLLEIVVNVPEISLQKSDEAPYNYSPQVVHWDCSQWTSWDHSKRRQSATSLYWSSRIVTQSERELYRRPRRHLCVLRQYLWATGYYCMESKHGIKYV